jgi:hypothetical protein
MSAGGTVIVINHPPKKQNRSTSVESYDDPVELQVLAEEGDTLSDVLRKAADQVEGQ